MRYYWMKLKQDFFRDLRVKKLRQSPNGAALTLLYLETLLSALQNGGVVPLLGIDDPATELSLLLDEPEADCAALLDILFPLGLVRTTASGGLYLPMLEDYTGSETEAAARMRRLRENRKEAAGTQTEPTACPSPDERADAEKTNKSEASLFSVPTPFEHCSTEKEIEKEIEIDPEIEAEAEKTAVPEALAEPTTAQAGPTEETALPLPLKTGGDFCLTKKQLREYEALYPEVDVPEQLRAMRGWLISNPASRKTGDAMLRFVNGWLNKQQTMIRSGARRGKETPPSPGGAGLPCPGRQTAGDRGKPGGTVNSYSGKGYSAPPSYDIDRAMEAARTTVPKLKKRAR